MKWRRSLLLSSLALAVVLVLVLLQTAPGFMDADYYYATGLRIANGKGLTEPFIWNYLGRPEGIPHPSHSYWMPLSSFLAAAGMIVTGARNFLAARLVFILLAVMIPPLTYHIALAIQEDQKTAFLAGLFACFSSFYLPFLTVTDSFAPTMALGGLLFLSFQRREKAADLLLMGVLCGALHLSRAEGILWLGTAALHLMWNGERKVASYMYLVGGYLLIFGPWMVRNIQAFNHPLGGGGLRTLWITDYDQIFIYPGEKLTFQRWWGQGWNTRLRGWLWALGQNLKTTLAVQGQIFLSPLVILAGLKREIKAQVKAFFWTWMGLLLMMSFVFPYQGARGAFFHAVAAMQPLLWALAAMGFSTFIAWGVEKRSWVAGQAWRVLGVGAVVIIVGLSSMVVKSRVIGEVWQAPKWNQSFQAYKRIGETLRELEAGPQDVIMINNPPGYYVANWGRSIVIPDGNIQTVVRAADRYDADYLVLESNHPRDLDDVYNHPESAPGLVYLVTRNEVHYFAFPDRALGSRTDD